MPEPSNELPPPDLGRTTIMYENANGDVTRTETAAEHVVYFGDHWQVRADVDDDGNDVVRRIPRERVYHVERTVEEFHNRVDSLIDREKLQLEYK